MMTHHLRTLILKVTSTAIAVVVAALAALLINWLVGIIDRPLNKSSHRVSPSVQYVLPVSEWSAGHPLPSRIIF